MGSFRKIENIGGDFKNATINEEQIIAVLL